MFTALSLTLLSLGSCRLDIFKPCLEGEGAKETAVFDVDPIVGFEINTAADVLLIDGDTQYVEITAAPNLLDKIEEDMEIDNGILKIGMKGCVNILRHEIDVVLVIPGIKEIGLSGAADIVSEDTLFNTASSIKIRCNGSGDFDLDFGALDRLDVKVSGSADVELSGSAEDFEITISGSADFDCFDLMSVDCDIDISGSANIEVYVTDYLDVDITGSGEICYKGSPGVESSISGSGDVYDCN